MDEANAALFLALPRRPGLAYPGEADGRISVVRATVAQTKVSVTKFSELNYAFNVHWARARNARRLGEPIAHFAMQHDDIRPAACWADVLIREGQQWGADVVSAVVPLKDDRGLTSTGIRNARTGDVRRLTMTELFHLPETFGVKDLIAAGIDVDGDLQDKLLVANTGLWICRFDVPWVSEFTGFCDQNSIVTMPSGEIAAAKLSEDWIFSEWCWRQGIRVMATRKVAVGHVEYPTEPSGHGNREFRNDSVWGCWQTDLGDELNA
ncbi:MAG TPA: hypothetical protein VFE62_01665 [Gemmataceae bacterium]|nr:hypothetical protein [Gemmataceae bacterium]